ncbi:MAG: efflux RND transporter periplasmic adaptor subunit [Sterolibacterium sp.]|nr:efflux RND transporter periplasmic adaptor subunit [Sterolibacterium sp.]
MTVVTLKTESVSLTRELPGRVTSSLVAEVRPLVTGIVQQRFFTEGTLMKAGQPLYQIDDATYRADASSARASLGRAEATLESARLKAQRSAELAKIDAVSVQDNENAIAALRQAEADVGVAKAAVERSSAVLGYCRITSPIAGRIGKSSVTQGALVTANQATALATVQQLNPIYVDLTQTSNELLQLRQQFAAGTLKESATLPVTLLLEDGSRYGHAGKLAFSEVSIDPTTGSYALRVVVPNPQNVLLPGMYVRSIIGAGMRPNAVLVPQQGITRDPKGGANAMLIGKDGKVEARNVKVSQTVGDKWLVEEGLAAGDKVIVEGLQKIRPGMPVQVTEAGAASAPAAK